MIQSVDQTEGSTLKIVIGGGSGYVGQALVRSLVADGHEAVVLTRRPSRASGAGRFTGWETVPREVDGADAVVNLAGLQIFGPRWSRHRKAVITGSRVNTTRSLARAIAAAERPPAVFVTASGIDYYGECGDATCDESSPVGTSFLAELSAEWEAVAQTAGVPWVGVRTPLVIGPGAPIVRIAALPFRLFVGGPIGGGRQWFPWIHIDDLVGIYRLAILGKLEGPVNAVAPELLRQRDAARDFGEVLHRPSFFPAPVGPLRLLLGEQADLILHGQRAISTKLGQHEFRYRGLRAALADSLGS